MDFYLQFGYGMMSLTNELLAEWRSGGVILSPRDLTRDQLARVAEGAIRNNAEPLIDPQCYAHDGDHAGLASHGYYQAFQNNSTASFSDGSGIGEVLARLATLNGDIGVTRHILPGRLADPLSDDWFAFHENMVSAASHHFGDEPRLATIALSSQGIASENDVESIVERASEWEVNGYYVVAQSPNAYLVSNPVWIANFLLLISGLKLSGKSVIVGYANQQALALASTGVDVIASGTWKNVRSFPLDKFYAPDEGDIAQRATWYYCPQAYSEYKLPTLDIANRRGILRDLIAEGSVGTSFSEALFSGAAPSNVNWPERNSFKHYLSCLRAQALSARQGSYRDTLNAYFASLDRAGGLLQRFHQNGVLGNDRDFRGSLDDTRSGLITFDAERGRRMEVNW